MRRLFGPVLFVSHENKSEFAMAILAPRSFVFVRLIDG
jgi:hypothetical protein